jgi:hypothetical protein
MPKVMIALAGMTVLVLVGVANAHEDNFLRRWIATFDKVLSPQDQVLLVALVVHQMGSDDTCPRFKVVKSAIKKELDEAGINQSFQSAHLLVSDMIKQDDDRSQLCGEAWELFGPNGTYKRKMLEAQ